MSSVPSKASSDSMVECELEEEDDWVVVKKQRITILVPPPSPQHAHNSNPVKTEDRVPKRSSGAQNKRRHVQTEDKHQEPSAITAPASASLVDRNGINSTAQELICSPVASRKKFEQPSWAKLNGNIKGIALDRKSLNMPRLLPIGSLDVVNMRVRALNLERKLDGLGGLRRWLASLGLSCFTKVFEREKVGKYQLVNLTMRTLKEMGMDAVGPRRKLIHAIDRLCQPYYFKAL